MQRSSDARFCRRPKSEWFTSCIELVARSCQKMPSVRFANGRVRRSVSFTTALPAHQFRRRGRNLAMRRDRPPSHSIGRGPLRNVARVHAEFSDVHNLLTKRQTDKLDIRALAELALDQITRVGHRLGADLKYLGDFFRRLFRKQQTQNLKFARRQDFDGSGLAGKAERVRAGSTQSHHALAHRHRRPWHRCQFRVGQLLPGGLRRRLRLPRRIIRCGGRRQGCGSYRGLRRWK
jgi:hypothetical protein